MSTLYDWINVTIPEDVVEKIKSQKIDYKQNLQGDIKTRWVGKLGEIAFKQLCKEHNIPVIDKTTNGASWVDFIVKDRKIDVKTVATNYYPTEEYACNISPIQHYKNKEAEEYVFARFVIPKNLVVILGHIDKHEFEKNALTIADNTQRTKKFTTQGEMLELEIKYLKPFYFL